VDALFRALKEQLLYLAVVLVLGLKPAAVHAFEGHIRATITRGSQTSGFLYTATTNQLRIENTATNWPHARNIVNLQTGEFTLVYPHNRSFVRLKPVSEHAASPGVPGAPGLPPSLGGLPPGLGPRAPNLAGRSAMPAMGAMPMMPISPREVAELKATGGKTNLLGFACARYEVKQRGEILEIWATDHLFPFQPYRQNQPHRFGPRTLEDQWPELLKARQLFPLLVTVRVESGPERYRFEVDSVQPEKITAQEGKLFQPPAEYYELQPLPF
jgi:hypothetical protein